MKKLILITASIIFIIAGCKKDDHSEMSRTDLLTNGCWKITAAMYDADGNGSFETNTYGMAPPCVNDNYVTFHKNNELELNEGVTKCDANDPQTETLFWQLVKNDSELLVDGENYIIKQLDNQTMVLQDDVTAYGSLTTFSKR